MQKIVLAYSGGLDTSVAIRWLAETYGAEIVTLTIDLGSQKDLDAIHRKAVAVGAAKAIVMDARDVFLRHFAFRALQAGALYEGEYPLATALGRPLIAKLLVDVARQEGAQAIAHGCTGKGNDQVRFDVATAALAPDLKVIGPVREWNMTREEEIAYAEQHDIPVPVTVKNPYSVDENLWGRSIECGVLEDPWVEPPEDIYQWTCSAAAAPEQPLYVELSFREGVPVALDGQEVSPVALLDRLNELAGSQGVGRIDHVENRLVGIKSREIYEAPAAVVLHRAHQALEDLTLTKDTARFKALVAQEYADLIYNGLWFSSLHQALAAFVSSTQRHVNGDVRVKLQRGVCQVVGRRSADSLYRHELATYDKGDLFDHSAAVGFIKLWGLPLRTEAQVQLLRGAEEHSSLLPPLLTPVSELRRGE